MHEQKQVAYSADTLKQLIQASNIPVAEIIVSSGFKKFTWYHRLKYPQHFTVEEIEKITLVLNKGLLEAKKKRISPEKLFKSILQSAK